MLAREYIWTWSTNRHIQSIMLRIGTMENVATFSLRFGQVSFFIIFFPTHSLNESRWFTNRFEQIEMGEGKQLI
jgi:hypothetical protein